jgi:anti-sigma B factor antagonist
MWQIFGPNGLMLRVRRDEERVCILAPDGDLCILESEDLHQVINVLSPGASTIVLDLAGVGLVSNPGMDVLVETHRSIREHGGRVCLVRVQPRVLGLLHRLNLDAMFEIHESVDQALVGDRRAQ